MTAKLNVDFYNGEDIYNDGAVEELLYRHYKFGEPIDECDREVFFYTTNIRENILNWYPFSDGSDILEIGAGLGTITGMLASHSKTITAVEASKRRAQVIYERHSDHDNLLIYQADFKDIEFTKKYDYIVMVGVLEYAKIYQKTRDPYKTFLNKIKKLLKPGGKLLIAIENRYGIKYWAGSSEDHLGREYAGLLGYDGEKVRTFGKTELTNLLQSSGFNHTKMYYPFPDYKLPSVLFADSFKVSDSDINSIPIYNYKDDDLYEFDPRTVLKGLNDNNQFDFFVNSFLVEAMTKSDNFSNVSYVRFQPNRSEKYNVITKISDDRKIEKIPLNDDAKNHLKQLEETHKRLDALGIKCCKVECDSNGVATIEFIEGQSLLEMIIELLKKGRISDVEEIINDFFNYLRHLSVATTTDHPLVDSIRRMFGDEMRSLPMALFDLHFGNIIVGERGDYCMIDQEWVSDLQIPIEYNEYASLNVLYASFPEINRYFNIQYFYDKYGLTKDKIDVIEECRQYFFWTVKKYENASLKKILDIGGNIRYKNQEIDKLNKTIVDMRNKLVRERDFSDIVVTQNEKLNDLLSS